MQENQQGSAGWRGTTILTVRKGNRVVVAGDGQVSLGPTVIKHTAKKVRRLAGGKVITGFAGATADAFTLFERLEAKLEQYPDQLMRACVELAKDWRTDRYLRRLEAMMIVADKKDSLVLTGTGDVLSPDGGVMGKKEEKAAGPEPIATDVPDNYWARSFIEQALATGIIEKYPDGSFQPDKKVNRAEFAVPY